MSTSSAESEDAAEIQQTHDEGADQISGWMVEAINNGHYTVEQVERLKAQKRRVNETIAAVEQTLKFEHGQVTMRTPPGASTSLPAVNTKTRPPLRTVSKAADRKPTLAVAEQLATLKMKLVPECHWCCCHACRPTYRDRSWQTFETILSRDTTEHGSTKFGERKVIDVNVARNLGLRKPCLVFGLSEDLRTETSEDDSGSSSSKHSRLTDGEGEGQHGDEASASTRTEVKRAFRGMLMSRRRHSYSSSISKKSRRRSSEGGEGTGEFNGTLWNELNNQLLRDATEVRLPGKDGMDGLEFEEGEVEVEDGVAVTEEAVDLGTADIIISV